MLDFNNLVVSVAAELRRSLSVQAELSDLYQAGWLGLLDARKKFDPARHVRFGTYARFRIRGAILDSLRAQDYLSRELRRQWNRVEAKVKQLSQEHGRCPSDQEVAEASGAPLENVFRLRNLVHVSTEHIPLRDHRIEPVEKTVYRSELMQLVRNARLSERQARVLRLLYWNGLPMRMIGAILGVSVSRVSQIHAAALHRLRLTFRARAATSLD